MSAMSLRAGIALVVAFMLAGRITFSQTPAPPPASSVTYTEEQAGRGGIVFGRVCIDCHSRKDMSNPDFRVKWNGRTAFDFFDRVRSTMPESDPGSLARAEYLDVTAYVAKLNGLAAGTAALPDDDAALKKLTLSLPPQHQ